MALSVSIHQPEHLPWRGFVNKMIHTDLFILLDHVQYTKNNWQNRNKVIVSGKPSWLTVPVLTSGHLDKPFYEIEIDYKRNWQRKYLASIFLSYSKAPYFSDIYPSLENIISSSPALLVDLNISLINLFRSLLSITTPIIRSSSIHCSGSKSDLLLSICRSVQATEYLSGIGAKSYLNTSLFAEHNISLSFQSFSPQHYPSSIYDPHLSTIDLLFQHGPNSRLYI